jgi:hypothetical protein
MGHSLFRPRLRLRRNPLERGKLISPTVHHSVGGDRSTRNSKLLGWPLVFAFLSCCCVVGVTGQTLIPTWTIGDYWTYRIYSSRLGTSNVTGTENLQLVGVETLVIEGRNYSTYHLVTQQLLNGINQVVSYDQWYSPSDLGLLRERISSPNDTQSMTYSPPLGLHWPLSPNVTWTSTGNINVTTQYSGYPPQSYTIPYSIQFSVEPSRQLTIPAGTFEVIPILMGSASNGERRYWSPSVGNYVQVDNLRSGQSAPRTMLLSYGHAAPSDGWLGLPLFVALGTGGALGLSATIVLVSRRKRLHASFPHPTDPKDQPKR